MACVEHYAFCKVKVSAATARRRSDGLMGRRTPLEARPASTTRVDCERKRARGRQRTRGTHQSPIDPSAASHVRLRAFQPQQHWYTLVELELPRLLAPDLPSNSLSIIWLLCSQYNYLTLRQNIVISCHYLYLSELGNLRACCLP